ncbi:hypothetical protein EB008_01085 [bacterium]|nr:hypothetical protein [bacterium]
MKKHSKPSKKDQSLEGSTMHKGKNKKNRMGGDWTGDEGRTRYKGKNRISRMREGWTGDERC